MAPSPNPVMDLIMDMWAAKSVAAYAELGIPEILEKGTESVEKIALELKLDAPSLYRFLRAVSFTGMVSLLENKGEKYPRVKLTREGMALLSNPPSGIASMKAYLLAVCKPGHMKPWNNLIYSIQTGLPGTVPELGNEIWDYYNKNTEEGQLFAAGMSSLSSVAVPAIIKAYPIENPNAVIMDVGGSHGDFLIALLNHYTNAKGILFDLPKIIETAVPCCERMSLVPGDFFNTNLPEADIYLMKHILHDWNDEKACEVLKNVAKSMKRGASRLLVVEMVIEEDESDRMPAFMDLNMLAVTHGKERTVKEYEELFSRNGLNLTRVVRTECPLSIIEAILQ